MPDDSPPKTRKHDFATRLSHGGRAGTHIHGFVNLPLYRGSTVLQPDVAGRQAAETKWREQALMYGANGTPTHFPLEDMIAEIEGGTRCQIVSTGLAAVTTPLLAHLNAGDHCLMPDSIYGPSRRFAQGMMVRLGITTTFYDPCISAPDLQALLRPNTKVLYLESPARAATPSRCRTCRRSPRWRTRTAPRC
jgi:cystathionine beta-lyase